MEQRMADLITSVLRTWKKLNAQPSVSLRRVADTSAKERSSAFWRWLATFSLDPTDQQQQQTSYEVQETRQREVSSERLNLHSHLCIHLLHLFHPRYCSAPFSFLILFPLDLNCHLHLLTMGLIHLLQHQNQNLPYLFVYCTDFS
ncbi:hypothetical protein V2J09_009587 [Rumex salicifolius]